MSSLAEITASLNNILNQSPADWGTEQMTLYQTLDQTVNRYRRHFLEAQFRQDLSDILDNIYAQQWFTSASSEVQKQLRHFCQRLRVISFNLARNESCLRVNLHLSLMETTETDRPLAIKLQYFNSPNKFSYHLFFEDSEEQRAYLAKNHPDLEKVSASCPKIPELDKLYRKFLPTEFRQIPAGLLMKAIAEIIMFYDETETVVKSPISSETKWSLSDA